MNQKPDPKQTQDKVSGSGTTQKSGHLLDGYTVAPPSAKDDEKSPYYKSAAPSISLPKGGGALKGIDEKFTVNAINGTASLQVGFPLTPGRSGFTPALTLQYNSGSGNSEFGLGWGLSLPSIKRKTDKKLPRYNDARDSDVFLLAGAEDLVASLLEDSDWTPDEFTDGDYIVKRYRPRIEGLFARIEYIRNTTHAGSWWRVITKDNIATYYGLTEDGRISDPEDESRIFKWLPQLSCDQKGNVQVYEYILEDLEEVPIVAHERNRNNGQALFLNRYLKSVKYCNDTPFYISETDAYEPVLPLSGVYWMQAVLDYGDHDDSYPEPTRSTTHWPCRKDPFSDFHAGFEIRTYRKCRRVLMFHFFRELHPTLDIAPHLIRSLDLEYKHDDTPDSFAEADYITVVKQTGYKRIDATTYFKKSLPPLTVEYEQLKWNTDIHIVDRKDVENAPQGLTGPYQWVDLWGVGLPGILSEQAEGWFYKSNMGDGHFTPAVQIAEKPSFTGLGNNLQWQDLDADGRRQVVSMDTTVPGYFELDDDQQWQSFRAFNKKVNINLNSPYTKMIDLDGDGRPDILLTEERAWTWYANKGKEGYDIGGSSQAWLDEEKGPRLLLNDQLQSIFLADMNGDGLTDLVRIKNGEVCYWPNMGYGKFGRKVTMTNAPVFDNADDFNPIYITLADISGTGAPDILYMGNNKCTAWINFAGNALSDAFEINPLPGTEQYSKIAVIDFLGNGTACIVWSSPLPQHADAPMRYIDLMGGKKPHIMKMYMNGMGKVTNLTYKSSTKYYIEDKLKGIEWATKLPFPVQCLSEVTTSDVVSETTYKQSYSYHHGYYDHEEREFRGFGRVDSIDVDTAIIDESNELDQAPVLTKTWYHTGAWMRRQTLLRAFAKEYYPAPDSDVILPADVSMPTGMNAQEMREAYRALKSVPLRQEVYALDGTDKEQHPYVVTASGYCVKMLQPQKENRFGTFYTYQEQSVSWHFERNVDDPRISHELVTAIDEYGNIMEKANVVYPRNSSQIPVDTPGAVVAAQEKMLAVYTQILYTNDELASKEHYRLRLPYESKDYELGWLQLNTTPFWLAADIKEQFTNATSIDFTDAFASSQPLAAEKRMLSCARSLFLSNDLADILELGIIESLAIPHESYQLAFSGGVLNDADWYDGRITNAMLDEGGYKRDGTVTGFPSGDPASWVWIPSGTVAYDSNPAESFYLPFVFIDPWGNETTIGYWDNGTETYYLLPKSVTDAKGNISTVNAYDWRCLQPTQMTDPNLNISEILYDALCMPVATAMKGKGSEGDTLAGIDPEDAGDISTQADFWDDPYGEAGNVLQGATWRCIYDLEAQPTAVAMIAREEHYADNPTSPTLVRISYSDGFGRVAMHKVQATDDPITSDPRWTGSGKTVYNNKGNVVMQYELYYSSTHEYDTTEQSDAASVSPRVHYDPLGRAVRTDLPDGSYSKVEWDAWKQVSYDNNDTVADSEWYEVNTNTTPFPPIPVATAEQQDAAAKAYEHRDTPIIMYLDTLARPFYTTQFAEYEGDEINSYVDLDILSNRIAVHDARETDPNDPFICLSYGYNLLKAIATQTSIDSGTQYMMTDAAGQPLYAWDAEDRQFHFAYDELRRPLTKEVTQGITPITYVLEVKEYGEDLTDPHLTNMRGQLHKSYDNAGLTWVDAYDFKGVPVDTKQQLLTDHTIADVDWDSSPALNTGTADTFITEVTIDALGRPVTSTDPGGNVTRNTYDKAGALNGVYMTLAGIGETETTYVSDIRYNARGQREAIWYGNGTKTAYTYDDKTYRLIRLLTTKSSDIYQDLNYWYDPVGNITQIQDDAQQDLYFSNSVITPNQDFTYDALYRLIIAEGRELIGTAIGADDNFDDAGWQTSHQGNATAVQSYTQHYTYDVVGNILELQHSAGSNSYTRTYNYIADTNKLDTTQIGSSTPFSYTYDDRGNMETMPHLPTMAWNAQNELHNTNNASNTLNTYYNYSGGQRIRKVCLKPGRIREERIYLGSYELYRKYINNVLDIERFTVHIADDTGRIAMEEKRTYGTDSAALQLTRYIYSNHLSTASLELDENAAIISYEEYHPYGTTSYQAMNASINAVAKRYRYTGKERDEETGLYYHGARYYIPWLCRWGAVDPMESKYAGMSPYNYSFNNPIKYTDKKGREPETTTPTTTYSTPDGGKVSIPTSDEDSAIELNKVYFGKDRSQSITFGQTSLFQFTISEGELNGVYQAKFKLNEDGTWEFGGYFNQHGNKYQEGPNSGSTSADVSSGSSSGSGSDGNSNSTSSNAGDVSLPNPKNTKETIKAAEDEKDKKKVTTAGFANGEGSPQDLINWGVGLIGSGLETLKMSQVTELKNLTKELDAVQKANQISEKLKIVTQTERNLKSNIKVASETIQKIKNISQKVAVVGIAVSVVSAIYKGATGTFEGKDAVDLVVSGALMFVSVSNPIGFAALLAFTLIDGSGELDSYKTKIANFFTDW